MKKNPIPVLHNVFGISLSELMAMSKMPPIKRDTIRRLAVKEHIPRHMHARFFIPTMTIWGKAINDGDPRASELWECYFPNTKPHLYHLLSFVFYHTDDQLADIVGISERTLHTILRKPKLSYRQLRMIAPYAVELRDALSSPKRKEGVDPLYMSLHRAIRDTNRIYKRGEL